MRDYTKGFSLVELLLMTFLLLLILMASSTAFKGGLFSSNSAASTTEVQQNVRACINLILRDFMIAGADITMGGIPVPRSFLQSEILYPIVPQSREGVTINGITTDKVIIAYSNITYSNLALDRPPEYCINNIATSGAEVTLDVRNCQNASSIKSGDILLIKNNASSLSALGYVTGIPLSNDRVEFALGDPLQLNAAGADSPIGRLSCRNRGFGQDCRDSAAAFKIEIISYYIDDRNLAGPVLMRRRNGESATLLSFGIENLQITYTLSNGNSSSSPTNPLDIRKATVFLLGRSKEREPETNAFYRFPLEGQVTTRNLAYAANN